jgi:hypothetical protein
LIEALSASELGMHRDMESGGLMNYRAVSVILAHLRLMVTAEFQETNVFMGADETRYLMPMGIREAIEEMVRCRDMVIYIDEVPTDGDIIAFCSTLFLRNIIRSMGGLCILSGTESALMGMTDPTNGSRYNLVWPWGIVAGSTSNYARGKLGQEETCRRIYETYLL